MMAARVIAVYHTLLAALAAVVAVSLFAFIAYVKWEEYARQRRRERGQTVRMMGVEIVEAAAVLPVTVQEFIDHARLNALTVDVQPNLIERELQAATARAEQYTRRALITQKLRALFAPENGGSSGGQVLMKLPRPPVQVVMSLETGGQLADPSTYQVAWGVIAATAFYGASATAIYTAGYGDTAEAVPWMIREGILEYATALYESRDGERGGKYVATAGRTLPAGVIDLWRPFQVELSG